MRLSFLIFLLIPSLIFSVCNQNSLKIVKNQENIILNIEKLPAKTYIEVGNPNCFDININVKCYIEGLECKANPNILIIKPKKTEKVEIYIYGNISKDKYNGKVVITYFAEGFASINVPYNLIINIKKERSNKLALKEISINYLIYALSIFIIIFFIYLLKTKFKLWWIKFKIWMLKRRL